MNKTVLSFTLLLVSVWPAVAQVSLPQAPSGVTGNYYRTNGGSTTWYYWIQAYGPNWRSPLSNVVSFPNAPATLTAIDHVGLSWNQVPGAVGYDVLRNSTGTTPTGTVTNGISIGQPNTNLDDQGITAVSYVVSTGGIYYNGLQVLDNTGALNTGVAGVSPTYAAYGSLTLTQLNAGTTVIPATVGRTLKVIHYSITATGAPTTCTLVEIADTNGTPVVVVSAAIANFTTLVPISDQVSTGVSGITTTTLGAALTAGAGVQILKTGSSCAVTSALKYVIDYTVQ